MVASCSGIVRLFNSINLQFVEQLLPYNSLLSKNSDPASSPSCVAARFVNGKRNLVATVYEDNAMVIWDCTDIKKIKILHHFPCHAGKVFGVEVVHYWNHLIKDCRK